MARKFSLKDNPIFQRLEIPKLPVVEARSDAKTVVEGSDPTRQEEVTPSSEKELNDIKFTPSKFDPQNLTSKEFPINFQENEVDSKPARQEDKGKTSGVIHQDQEEDIIRQGSTVRDPPLKSEDQNLTLKKEPPNIGLRHEALDEGLTRAQTPTDLRSTGLEIHSMESVPSPRDEYDVSQRNEGSGENEALSKFEPQNLSLKKNISDDLDSREKLDDRSRLAVVRDATNTVSPDLREAFDKSLFFSFYNEMNDELLPQLDAAEQILYSRLFRLSYGFNRNYCTVSQPVLREKTGLSRNTIRTGLQSLVQKEWVLIVGAGNHVSTTYRIMLPRERNRGKNLDAQKMTLKNRRSNSEVLTLRRKDRSSKNDMSGDQKTEVQNLTGTDGKTNFTNKNKILDNRGPEFEPQKSSTLTITDNILTLSLEEIGNLPYEDNKLTVAAARLVALFYSQLGQQPSSAKQSKGVIDCIRLFRDGFSEEQIEYGINWLLARHPGTGAFSRIAHFIDQALKERQAELHGFSEQEKKRIADEQERLVQQRFTEQGKQIEQIKTSLDPEELEALNEEAAQLVELEHGGLKFGRETLIQIKLNELIRERYLKETEDDS